MDNNEYNADELTAPEWLNAEYFEQVLRPYEKAPELRVVDVKMSPASSKGDHYASIMFRAIISYETHKGKFSKPLIIKTMPEEEGHKKQMLSESHLFETEIGMYTKVLPKFEEILRQAGDETKLCAPCVYHSLKPRQVIIFEDLVPKGYVVVRDRDATVDELKGAYLKLAKLHAVSFHVLHETPDFLKEFKHGLCTMPNLMSDPFMTTGLSNFLNLLDKVPELTKYKLYFKSMEHNYLELFKDVMEEYRQSRQPNGYYVLCHGDFHFRNMMFKHNKVNQSFEDCMLLDYQICNLTSITLDVIYSIYMLMGPTDRREHCEELIDFYFGTFLETLQKIGYKGELPNSAEFQRQKRRNKFYEMFLLFSFLPLLHGVRSNTVDIKDVLEDNEVRQKLYMEENFIEDTKFMLEKFEKLGYFD